MRLLEVGITRVLRTLGMWRPETVLARSRRGGRVILLERRRGGTRLLWLLPGAEEAFGVADVPTPKQMCNMSLRWSRLLH
jgi:hypothetical protein